MESINKKIKLYRIIIRNDGVLPAPLFSISPKFNNYPFIKISNEEITLYQNNETKINFEDISKVQKGSYPKPLLGKKRYYLSIKVKATVFTLISLAPTIINELSIQISNKIQVENAGLYLEALNKVTKYRLIAFVIGVIFFIILFIFQFIFLYPIP